MSDAERPKRRWVQFHLSTAMLMMVVAAIEMHSLIRMYSEYELWGKGSIFKNDGKLSLLLSSFLYLSFVFACGCLCEWLIRRREARKQ